MDEVWNGIRTVDYEHTRPAGTPLEWDLYTRSLIAWPQVLMDVPTPYGRLRRPGLVDIDEADHQHLVGTWHTRLTDPAYVTDLIACTATARARTGATLEELDAALETENVAAASAALADATAHLLTVMSTHIVNWLLPEAAWERLLAELLGSRSAALAGGLALMTPTDPGRLLNAHLFPAHIASSTKVPVARQHALERASSWSLAILLAATGDERQHAAARLVITLSRWAADSEERRAELRDRYLPAVVRWASLTGADLAQLSIADLITSGAVR
ncbi:hypothetical protein [Streptosporangium sp. NPDC051022]|uniref:hypothetical protein n=1 Tax=Streptosporangium sp. NPDC051022 TaxID=3155752 RepID=UPI003447BE93